MSESIRPRLQRLGCLRLLERTGLPLQLCEPRLILLQQTLVLLQSRPIVIQTRFIRSHSRLSQSG